MATLSRRQYYRSRVKKSMCKGRTTGKCYRFKQCKMTKGSSKRSKYCRKRSNKKR